MAQKEYKQLSCRDAGADCDFLVRAETEEVVMATYSKSIQELELRQFAT
jgi:predicted small metal-binding protein